MAQPRNPLGICCNDNPAQRLPATDRSPVLHIETLATRLGDT
jgi:hypothetical protein